MAAQSLNIDCGSYQSYTAADGTLWSADQYYSGGQQLYTSYTVAGTADSPLFRTACVGYYGDFSYAIPVSNGPYKLTLKFSEVQYSAAGQRIFNVLVNGNPVLSNFDVIAQGGFFNAVGRNVKLKFYLTNGSLYSFWVTPSAQGASYGYVAAGGPGFTSAIDTVGAAH